MPWEVTSAMNERSRFIEAKLRGEHESMAELCRAFGVSRKTGYKWWERFEQGGTAALHDRSRRWQSHPHSTDPVMVEMIVATRRAHPTWGPKKLYAWLMGKGYSPPAPSTIGVILRKEGCIRPRRKRARPGEFNDGLSAQDVPNAVWSADFKGWFRLKAGHKCYPLTITDGYSRYLLRCAALEHPDMLASREVFDAAFVEFGLPTTLRTDNGTPFSGTYGVSALSVWWVKLGIQPERIERGKPTQNGRHERMHRTLKADAIGSGAIGRGIHSQQRVFDHFRHEYNSERPHEALGMRTPATFYQPSNRTYPRKLESPEYPADWLVHRVRRDGSIRLGDEDLFVSAALRGEPVGLEESSEGELRIHYGPLHLATITAKGKVTRGARRRTSPQLDDPKREIVPTRLKSHVAAE